MRVRSLSRPHRTSNGIQDAANSALKNSAVLERFFFGPLFRQRAFLFSLYHSKVMGLSAFVIAGGKSSRMGEDKALIEFSGTTLLGRMLDIGRSIADQVFVVGDREKYSHFCPTLSDIYPGRGPLGGIHAALRRTQSDLNLVLAIDMPFVEPEFLRYLSGVAGSSASLVTVPHALGRYQPLCAIYRREFVNAAEMALASDRNKIDSLFAPEITQVIPQQEIERLAFPVSMFENLNTREDLERALGKKTE